MGQRRQPVAVNAFVILQIPGRDAQDVVILAGDKKAGHHVRHSLDGGLEIVERLLELAGQRDVNDGGQPETQHLVVQAGVIATDRAGLLKRIQPARAGGLRQADLVGQRGIADAPFRLERGQDGNINLV